MDPSTPNSEPTTHRAGPSTAEVLAMLGFFVTVGCIAGAYLVRLAGGSGSGLSAALGYGAYAGFALGALCTVLAGLAERR